MGDAEHRALAAAVLFGTLPYAGEGIALGVVLGSIHVPLGIMGVVELPVVHSAAGYTVLEVVGAVGQGQDGHRAAKGESGDADLLSVHVGEGPQVLHPLDVVGQLGLSEGAVDVVDALLAAVAGGAVVNRYLDDALDGPELVAAGRCAPAVHHRTGVRAAVHGDDDGVFLIGVQVYREAYRGREGVAVHLDEEHLRLCQLIVVILRALGITEDGVLSLLAASYLH